MRVLLLLVPFLLVVAGCEKKEDPVIVIKPDVVTEATPAKVPTPEGCEPSRIGNDGECREITTGRITIPECCGVKK